MSIRYLDPESLRVNATATPGARRGLMVLTSEP